MQKIWLCIIYENEDADVWNGTKNNASQLRYTAMRTKKWTRKQKSESIGGYKTGAIAQPWAIIVEKTMNASKIQCSRPQQAMKSSLSINNSIEANVSLKNANSKVL